MKEFQALAFRSALFSTLPAKMTGEINHKTQSAMMDKYDYLILNIILTHKRVNAENIRLGSLEEAFWKRIENDQALNIGHAKIGERVARLYLDGYIHNKNGYVLTRRGKEELSCQLV